MPGARSPGKKPCPQPAQWQLGAREGESAEDCLEGLGAAAGVARRLPARAGPGRAVPVAAVVVEAPLHRPRRQGEGALAQAGLQGLEVGGIGGPGSCEAGDPGFDGGGELLRAGFFLTAFRADGPALRSRASESCSLTSISSPVRRRRRWRSATSPRAAAARAAGTERLVRMPPELNATRKQGPWPGSPSRPQRQPARPHLVRVSTTVPGRRSPMEPMLARVLARRSSRAWIDSESGSGAGAEPSIS